MVGQIFWITDRLLRATVLSNPFSHRVLRVSLWLDLFPLPEGGAIVGTVAGKTVARFAEIARLCCSLHANAESIEAIVCSFGFIVIVVSSHERFFNLRLEILGESFLNGEMKLFVLMREFVSDINVLYYRRYINLHLDAASERR